jgi:hypothetical protein
MKIGSKNSLCPHSHFIEHLVGAFEKSPRESNLNHESSSLLIWWLKNDTRNNLQQSKITHKKNQSWSTTIRELHGSRDRTELGFNRNRQEQEQNLHRRNMSWPAAAAKSEREKHHSDLEVKLWAGPSLLHGWCETNKCQQKKIGASTRLSVLTRESREGKEN